MIDNVNPNRMELLRLKRRIQIAKRGHKLLKDKQDELVRQLFNLLKGIRELRERVEKELKIAQRKYAMAKASCDEEVLNEAFLIPSKKLHLKVERKKLLTFSVPVFKESIEGDVLSYGFVDTPPELDMAMMALDKALKSLIELAEKEKTLELLSVEIERTRRRVNALEFRLIPELEETVKFITQKLAEMERSDITRLMKIKDIVRGH